jgi:hypothetical protein
VVPVDQITSSTEGFVVPSSSRSNDYNVNHVDHGPLVLDTRCNMDSNMLDDIIYDLQEENGTGHVYGDQLIDRLEHYGFMIVPIEDPTNLFGIMEDSE